ncbi:MAG: extracellular solute-binding protein [Alphaproteobacteria bacterium]|nr:extracellular solute-binding protein [Alphaproteobacteria bacterium]
MTRKTRHTPATDAHAPAGLPVSRRAATFAIAAGLASLPSGFASAQAPSGRVTVVTSFSNDVTAPFKRAFEAAYPGVTLEVQNRNTNAGVRFVQETRSNNQTDLFWASAPDAFEVLKQANLLQQYRPNAPGIPERIGPYTINDPGGYYFGFAASGYGIMWNERYTRANRIPEPKEWIDLAKAEYFDHVIMTTPSRSGTTHLTVETILQGEGWEKGWRTLKAVGGSMRQITDRSFGVPDAVNSGQVGVGIVIDFFAFSAQAAGFPVKFVYPTVSTVVPANIGIIANAPNQAGARAFIDFVLSERGQTLLLEPAIRRLPVNPAIYARAPQGYPNPFTGSIGLPNFRFDVGVSERRYRVVDALFDQLITGQLEGLKRVTRAIHDVEARLARRANVEAAALVARARDAIAAMPITAEQAVSADITAAFRGGSGQNRAPRQAELEQQWSNFARDRHDEAQGLVAQAARLAG